MKAEVQITPLGKFINIIAENKEEAIQLDEIAEEKPVVTFSKSQTFSMDVCGKTRKEREPFRTYENETLTIQFGKTNIKNWKE